MALTQEIREGAIREATRRNDPEVLPEHVLLALLANDEVFDEQFEGWWQIVETGMGPHGSAQHPPAIPAALDRRVGWCATRASARRVAMELFEEFTSEADEDDDWLGDAPSGSVAASDSVDGDRSRSDDGEIIADFERPAALEIVIDESDDLDQALADLDRLVGLDDVKGAVRSLAATHRVNAERERMGLPAVPLSPHLVFTGNPGTGKTTVARIVARIYRHLGLVARGHLVETDRSGLVADYLGQTATKTKRAVKRALGGVLFIDEAYALVPARAFGGDGDQYGDEAISALLKEMEDRRGDFVVIVAGYGSEMARFIDSNPGLASRFQRYIDFPDYSTENLLEIFERLASSHVVDLGAGVREHLRAYIDSVPPQLRSGNGRFMRNLFEEMYGRMASRAVEDNVIEHHEITTLTVADVPGVDEPILEPDGPTGMYL